jgi:hypothetical protein
MLRAAAWEDRLGTRPWLAPAPGWPAASAPHPPAQGSTCLLPGPHSTMAWRPCCPRALLCLPQVWSLASGALLRSLPFPAAISAVALDAGEQRLYAAATTGAIYEVRAGRQRLTYPEPASDQQRSRRQPDGSGSGQRAAAAGGARQQRARGCARPLAPAAPCCLALWRRAPQPPPRPPPLLLLAVAVQ